MLVPSILQWLSFVPKDVSASSASRPCADPVNRDVEFRPTPTPYDPRLMLAGTAEEKGFFDDGSFKEYLAGWGPNATPKLPQNQLQRNSRDGTNSVNNSVTDSIASHCQGDSHLRRGRCQISANSLSQKLDAQ